MDMSTGFIFEEFFDFQLQTSPLISRMIYKEMELETSSNYYPPWQRSTPRASHVAEKYDQGSMPSAVMLVKVGSIVCAILVRNYILEIFNMGCRDYILKFFTYEKFIK